METKKGQRLGGRQKGTPNKKTQALLDKCAEKGIDVFDAMLEIVGKAKSGTEKFSMLKELAQYLYPKRKAIEHTGGEDFGKTKESEVAKEIREFLSRELKERE